MRNLKKVLSLALSLVMLLGMMVVGAGAAEYKDAASIEYKEAADVLGAINVINGRDDGSFDPKAELNRAEGAAIIFRMIMGGIDQDPVGTSGFVDVDGTSYDWASGYIAACAQQGILSGVGDNQFNPGGKLSGYAFGKMLLVALGYNADSQGYTGAGWEGNVFRDAYTRGINVDGVNMAANLTREQAAQMALQTLKATMVDQTPGISVNGVVIPGSKATDRTAAKGAGYDGKDDEKLQLCELYFPNLKLITGGEDDFDRPVNVWSYNGDEVTASSAASPVVTYTSAKKADQIAKDLRDYKVKGGKDGADISVNTSVTSEVAGLFSEDGKPSNLVASTDDKTTTAAAQIEAKTGNGKIVEVYASGDNITKVVVVVKSFHTLTADPSTRTRDDVEQVTVPGTGIRNIPVSRVSGWENLAKDDVVLVASSMNDDGEKVFSIEQAKSISGVVTGKRGDDLRIDGEYYSVSGLAGAANGWTKNDFSNEYTFYLDDGGFIIKGSTAAETSTTGEYAVVLDSAWYTGSSLSEGKHGEVKLLLSDGSTVVGTVSKVNGDGANGENGKIKDVENHKIVEYKVDSDDKYELTTLTSTTLEAEIKVTKGSANIVAKDNQKQAVNSATVFFAETGKDSDVKYTAYVGNSNVPTMSSMSNAYVVCKEGTTMAVAVYIRNNEIVDNSANDYVYIPGEGKISYVEVPNDAGNGVAYYEVDDAVINGEEGQTLKVTEAAAKVITDKGVLYEVKTKDPDTEAAKTATVHETDKLNADVNLAGGTITVSGTAYATTDETEIFRITLDQTVQVIAWDGSFKDDNDKALVIESDGQAKTVYIIEVEDPASAE